MKPIRPVYVVGGGHSTFMGKGRPEFIGPKHPDFEVRRNPGLVEHLSTALKATFETTGVSPTDIDKVYLSNFLGECFVRQGHLGSMLVAVENGLDGKPISRIEAACASGAAGIAAATDALQAGCDTALIAGVEIETNVPGREGVAHMALAAHVEQQAGISKFIFPHFFARRAKYYKEAHGASDDDIARVVTKAYANANRNPQALMNAVSMSFEEASTTSPHNAHFLEDPELRPHIRLHECTHFTDGASAVVIATREGLDRIGVSPADCTEILSYGHSVAALGGETNPLFLDNMNRATREAYTDAGISGADVDIAEVHDCFAINELQMYEALELCGPGEAPALLREGVTAIDGRMPVNTGGGLIAFGHPIGATGVKQVVEIWRQMKGRCGDYQVAGKPTLGVTGNLGGDDRTGIVMVHRNVN